VCETKAATLRLYKAKLTLSIVDVDAVASIVFVIVAVAVLLRTKFLDDVLRSKQLAFCLSWRQRQLLATFCPIPFVKVNL